MPGQQESFSDFAASQQRPPASQGQESFSDFAASQQGPSVQADATISARPHTFGNWLEDLEGDIRYGTERTLPGRVLHSLGARGTDVGNPESVGETMGGELVGPVVAAHGATEVPSHPLRGTLEMIRGGAQSAAVPLAATQPEFLLRAAPAAVAQQGVQRGLIAAGVDPDYAEAAGDAAGVAGAASPDIVENAAPLAARTAGRVLSNPRTGRIIGGLGARYAGGLLGWTHPVLEFFGGEDYLGPLVNRAGQILQRAGGEESPQMSLLEPKRGTALPGWMGMGDLEQSAASERTPAGEMGTAGAPEHAAPASQESVPGSVPQAGQIAESMQTPPNKAPALTPRGAPLSDVPSGNGESAARQYLTYMPEMDLRQMAGKRGIDVLATDKPNDIINKILDSLTPNELDEFAAQSVEQSRFPVRNAAEYRPPVPGSIASGYKMPRAKPVRRVPMPIAAAAGAGGD